MKKIKLLFLLLVSSVFLHGQEYLPILEENRVWSIMHEKHTLLGDTMINETIYKKLFYHSYLEEFTPDSLQYIAAMREDSLNEKVYFIWKNHEDEVLLYDFSLEVGNIFEVNSPIFYGYIEPDFYPEYPPRNLKVVEILDTLLAEKTRKALVLSPPGNDFIEYWFEGIGSSVGLIYAGSRADVIADAPYPFLHCLHENDLLVYQANDPWVIHTDTCYIEPFVNIEEIRINSFSISVRPTFFIEQITLVSDRPVLEIAVYNLTGRMVYQYQSSEPFSQRTITTAHWEKGLYIIRANDSRSFATDKIIKY